MDLYMVELAAADWAAALVWYRDALGLPLEKLDEARCFAMLRAGSGRIALKAGEPHPDGVRLYFHVADLNGELARLAALGVRPDAEPTASPEGYRVAFVRDPDGRRIGLFEWTAG